MKEKNKEQILEELAEDLGIDKKIESLSAIRKSVITKYNFDHFPSNKEIVQLLPKEKQGTYTKLLKIKPIRTASGISIISVMTKPYSCPHGVCIFCPGGEKEGTPQSYMKTEPATMRAIENEYDPKRQINSRIKQLREIGHEVNKAEMIIIGGTFMNLPKEYQINFVKECFDALNSTKSTSLPDAIKKAENAKIRNVGLSIETKPDWCKKDHVNLALDLGATRLEIGVETLSDEIYKLTNRGHTLNDVYESFQIAKDSGYKIVAHMMPGLPGSNPEKDFDDFKDLFSNSLLKPDMLKIYPTLVVPNTGLYKLFKKGLYEPYNTETVVNLLADVKKMVPTWMRIMRIQREIAKSDIAAGVTRGNIRELINSECEKRGYKCRCIRCREIGIRNFKENGLEINNNIKMEKTTYDSSGGKEIFLSYEDNKTDSLIGFLRLRVPSKDAFRKEIDQNTSIVRELHVYGNMVPVGKMRNDEWQHKGFGKLLMKEAEKISREDFSMKKILVISAIGTRNYYKKLGYSLEGPYMAKKLI